MMRSLKYDFGSENLLIVVPTGAAVSSVSFATYSPWQVHRINWSFKEVDGKLTENFKIIWKIAFHYQNSREYDELLIPPQKNQIQLPFLYWLE